MAPAFLEAAAASGIRTFEDQNGEMQEGSGGAAICNVRIRDGRRLNIPASYIMPTITTGNTQAPCVIIGERMAEVHGSNGILSHP